MKIEAEFKTERSQHCRISAKAFELSHKTAVDQEHHLFVNIHPPQSPSKHPLKFNMTVTKNVGIIVGSVRTNRVGSSVASFVKSIIESAAPPNPDIETKFTLIEIADFKLPVFNEPILPAMVPEHGEFQFEHSKAWSAEIAKYDAYIVITAEYNYGLPGGLKNAIDYLYHAWIGKPVLIIGYGILGGIYAVPDLTRILSNMHLDVVETKPAFEFPNRDPAQHNSSPGLVNAIQGKFEDDLKDAWTQSYTPDILKGYAELVEKFTAKKE
jgi:NAD(P)H-dependent FMN reductase